MPRINGLLFDKDGTLFDFEASWRAVADQTLQAVARNPDEAVAMAEAVGYDLPGQRFLPGSVIVAGAIDELAGIWADFRPDLGAAQIELVANDIASAAVQQGALAPAVPDLAGFLSDLRARGLMLGVATHDSEAAARVHLTSHGALDLFDFVAGYDSGHGLKPGPGMMHAFCGATGLAPSECAMIGDSIHDLLVAPSAGAALAIGVLTGPAMAEDLDAHADHVLPSIGHIPALLDRIEAAI